MARTACIRSAATTRSMAATATTASSAAVGDDTLNGGRGVDRLAGNRGNDTVDGGTGPDFITGNGGDDVLSGGGVVGGSGIDRVFGGNGNDTVNGGEGPDRLRGGAGNDTQNGDAGNDRMSGGTGNDNQTGGDGNDRIFANLGQDVTDGGNGDDDLWALARGDVTGPGDTAGDTLRGRRRERQVPPARRRGRRRELRRRQRHRAAGQRRRDRGRQRSRPERLVRGRASPCTTLSGRPLRGQDGEAPRGSSGGLTKRTRVPPTGQAPWRDGAGSSRSGGPTGGAPVSRSRVGSAPVEARVAPSILSAGLLPPRRAGRGRDGAGARVIHVDVMDGHFVPPITIGAAGGGRARASRCTRPAAIARRSPDDRAARAPDRSLRRRRRRLDHRAPGGHAARALRAQGASARRAAWPALAISPATPAELAAEVAHDSSTSLLCMTVNPGWGGQPFIEHSIQKLERLRALLPPTSRLEVDGGIDATTAPRCARRARACSWRAPPCSATRAPVRRHAPYAGALSG